MVNLQQNYPHEAQAELLAQQLPTISIVVPNYNGGATINATLQSLVAQNYPKLEIIVVDGGSTDNSVEIIKQFEQHLTCWISEKDRGQSNAINKGFALCTGEIVNWLCSDDILAPGTLNKVGQYFARSPDFDVLFGRTRVEFMTENLSQPIKEVNFWMTLFEKIFRSQTRPIIQDRENELIYIKAPKIEHIALMPSYCPISQPSCFYRRKLLDRPKPLDESYEYAMDFELWNYFLSQGVRWKAIDDILSITPISGDNKTSTGGIAITYEFERIYQKYVKERIPLTFWHRRLRYPLERFIRSNRSNILSYPVGALWILVTLLLAPFYGFKKVWAMRWSK